MDSGGKVACPGEPDDGCGWSGTPSEWLTLPHEFIPGKVTFVEQLGRGGMAAVFKARVRLANGKVHDPAAVKVAQEKGDLAEAFKELIKRESAVTTFLAESRSASRFVQFIDGQPNEIKPYLVLEYVPYDTLRKRVSDRGLTDLDTALVGVEALQCFEALEKCGVVHRDPTPGNIFAWRDDKIWRVKVADFGIWVRSHEDSRSLPGVAKGSGKGTPGYMSPEQARGHKVDARSDVFSLAITLWESRMRVQPVVTSDTGVPIAQPLTRPAGMDADLFEVFQRALDFDINQRFQSPGAFRLALEGILPRLKLRNDGAVAFERVRERLSPIRGYKP